MATSQPEVPVTAPVAVPSIWSDIKTTLRAIFGAIVTTATTTEDIVKLVRNEVKNLDELQQIRLDLTKAERRLQRTTLDTALPPPAE